MSIGERHLLVLGGARSGKSRHAQGVAEAAGGTLIFIATAQAFDQEMTDRIARHRADRGDDWHVREAPVDLADAIRAEDRPGAVILVDCLTLWASNLLLLDRDIAVATDGLIAALSEAAGRIILVSNEVGSGIVPDNRLARLFRDAAGTLNQRIAAAVSRVDLIVTGLALRLK